MRRSSRTRFLAASSFLLLMLSGHIAHGQVANVSVTSSRPADLVGLYRIDNPVIDATSTIHYLRLMRDGRSRLESVRIDAAGVPIRASVEIGPFHRHPWSVKTLGEGASNLCFERDAAESCMAFHQEMPRGDLLLFKPDANWGSPTLILRRQGSARSR
jgi:hypothetical protein